MNDKKSSWGHRILQHDYPTSAECTVPGCAERPMFQISAKTKGGGYTRHYCPEHAAAFAKKFGLPKPPVSIEEIRNFPIKRCSTPALKILSGLIADELAERSTPKQDLCFSFDETGPAQKNLSPYVARLFWSPKKNDIGRYYFPDTIKKHESSEGFRRVEGKYCVRPGSIVEKRLGLVSEDKKPLWLWYLVTDEGEEVPVAMPWDGQRRELVKQYLKSEISASSLLDSSDDYSLS